MINDHLHLDERKLQSENVSLAKLISIFRTQKETKV